MREAIKKLIAENEKNIAWRRDRELCDGRIDHVIAAIELQNMSLQSILNAHKEKPNDH